MKKLLIFSHEFPPCLGGVGSVAKTLKEGIGATGEYEVTVLTSSRTTKSTTERIISIPFSKQLWPFIYFYWLALNARKFDVIIANDPAAIFTVGKFFPKRWLAKVICFIHGEEKYLLSRSLLLRLIGFRGSFIRSLNQSKNVIFVSSYIEKLYFELYGLSLCATKRSVIHSGVSPKQFLPSIDLKTPNSQPVFLTVSRVVSSKGFDVMLDSFIRLKKMGIQFDWVIAGDGSYFELFKKKAQSSFMCENITFLGNVSRVALPELYQKSDFYISLSELNESYGLSYLEAAFSGVIPIGYKRCGTQEAFQYIHGGYLIENYKNPSEIALELAKIMQLRSVSNVVSCERTNDVFCSEVINEF